MAKLTDITSLLNVDLPNQKESHTIIDSQTKAKGQKRRSWLNNANDASKQEVEKGVYRPLLEKGSINQVDQSGSSTRLINQVYKPAHQKGSINQVYKPISISLNNLRGNPLSIIWFLFSLVVDDKDQITSKVTLSEMMKNLCLSRDSARTGLRFLLKNYFITRINYQAGKSGWSQYEINKQLFMQMKTAYQKGFINPIKNKNEKGSISSNSFTYNNKTITVLPEEWEKINFENLAGIGFTVSRLLDIYEAGTNTAEVVQGSINHFAYMLERQPEKYKDPLNVLIGTLRKGKDWFEKDYKSPQELAMQHIVEQKKRELERKEKLEKELFDLHYKEWESSLDEETKNAFIPESARRSSMSGMKTAELVKYFTNNIWPEVKAKAF